MGDAVWDDRAPHRSHPPATPRGLQETLITGAAELGLLNRMAGYWANAWIGPDGIEIFLPTPAGAQFFTVQDGQVTPHGPRIPYPGEGEGWSWDREGWILLCDGPHLRRCHPTAHPAGDLIFTLPARFPDSRLWQPHASEDGRLYTATVQHRETGVKLGTIVMERSGDYEFFQNQGNLDESLLTTDGAYLILLEGDDNRIITVATGWRRLLTQQQGAVAHAVCGASLLVGEDDEHGACVSYDLTQPDLPAARRALFSTWGMGHLSLRAGRLLLSDATHLSWVDLTTGARTPILAHGMISDGTYDTQVQASLDPTGAVAIYCSNKSGRLEAYCLELP